jgi:hypothetical protein
VERCISLTKVFWLIVILFLIVDFSFTVTYSYNDPLKDDYEILDDFSNCENCTDIFDENSDLLNCAGGIATGTVVKNGRSIFWKNRHYTGENEKPRFEHGAVYDYWMNTGTSWGMNEGGLAVGNFMQYGTLDNWKYFSDATYDQTYGIQSYLLGHYNTVAEAAFFAAYHMGGASSLGIVSAEPGVGAVVYSGTNPSGQHVCNITWINNTYMGLSNAYECDGEYDSKRWDAEGRLDDSYNEHGYIEWADVIQKGARDVKGGEQGSGAFTSCCVSKSNSLSSIIAVSGDPRWNGAANIAWTCLARQPLVGIYLPLGASYLQYTDERDIPSEFTSGGGMEDYVDEKVEYATNGAGQGSNTYYAEKVREVQNYTFQIENYSFFLYDTFMVSLNDTMSQETVESLLQIYVDTIVPDMISAYENETYINGGNPPPQISNIARTTSDPLDTNPLYGWVNMSCTVTDNVAVSQVILKIWTPSGSWNNVSMVTRTTGDYYYRSTTAFSTAGNYSYSIYAKDTSNNTNTTSNMIFSMSPNWDNNNDGRCTILDYVMISNHYDQTGSSGWIREDVDNSGVINVLDLITTSNHYYELWW